MKKIINGFRYDTEISTLVGEASSDCGKSDFRWFAEKFYKTPRKGFYFLVGSGGPMSRWAQKIDNGYTDGRDIFRALSTEDALNWAETHLSASVIEEHFNELVKDA